MTAEVDRPSAEGEVVEVGPPSGRIEWRELTDGLFEASERGVPAVIAGDAAWTTAGARLDHIAAKEPRLAEALAERSVPIRLDTVARPDVTARHAFECWWLSRATGPPTVGLADGAGRMRVAFQSLVYEGLSGRQPSLAAIIAATHDRLAEIAGASAEPISGDLDARLKRMSQTDLSTEADEGVGRHEGGYPLRPFLLHHLAGRASRDGHAAEALRREADRLKTGGVRDQIGAGFHRAAREEHGIVPHFEKPVPLNAEMAAALAHTATVLGDVEIQALAAETAGFAAALARRDPAIGAIEADARHYTWTPAEFSSAIGPENLQVAGLHFHMTRAPVAHVIYQARSVADVAALGHSGETVAGERLCNAVKALALERDHRPAPASVPVDTTAWRAATLAGLARATIHGVDVIGGEELGSMLSVLAADRFHRGYGWRRSPEDHRYFLEDQAIALDAVQAIRSLSGIAGDWAALENETFEAIGRGFCGAEGRLLSRHKDDDEAEESVALLDDILPSPIATFCVSAAARPEFAPTLVRYGRWSRALGPKSARLMGFCSSPA